MCRSEAFCLVPVIVAFYVDAPNGAKAPAWNEALLFGGNTYVSSAKDRNWDLMKVEQG